MSNSSMGNGNPLDHVFNAADLLAMDLPAPRWIVPDLLPEGLTLIAGKSKAGKSWWALQTALTVADEQGDVLYLALEDTPRRLQERIVKVLEGRPVPHRLEIACQGRWPRLDAGGVIHLRQWLEKHRSHARLIIVDTLAKVKPTGKRNGNPYEEDYAALTGLKQLADEFGIGIVVVHHLRKQSDADDPFNEISGTTALMGCADTSMVLRRPRNGNKADLFVTGRDVEERQIPMIWEPDRCRWSTDQPEESDALPENRKTVIELLRQHGPMSMRQLIESIDKPEGTIKGLLSRMVRDAQLVNRLGTYCIVDAATSANADHHCEIGTLDETHETDETSESAGTGETDESPPLTETDETGKADELRSAA